MGLDQEQLYQGTAAHPFSANDFAIDDYREMKVIAIGAGMSGILAGIRFATRRHGPYAAIKGL